MGQTHQREEAIFDAALELPPGQRAAHLDHACGGDAALRQRIESLLKADESSCGILDSPTDPAAAQTINVLPASFEKAGDRIGRYKLLQQIGEGGCGVVYMAEQEEPVSRRVALKVIKLGLDTKSVIARFEAERQALALMDHPNIAKVLDAGATETGRPYFVMELVRGLKITEYCDEARLSTNARLDLFIQVCQAIQHAHQKGIIHRDIKPSNILVTINDGVPVPKVIDFGIAKATGGLKLTNKTLFTAFEQFIGTPAYMSPEQAVLTSLDIDTRSDIYALGVLLYELLTGKTPFDAQELLAIGLDEMRRTIREQEPPRPSTRISTLAQNELSTTAQRRGIEAPKLVSELRGDLDWIVMKALEKDRARRYETANGLASDIQRHLNNEPVVACPPTAAYRFQKMVRRNRLAFTAAAAVVAALVIGLGISTWMFFKERQARRQEVTAREQAETNFNTARSAIDRMFTRVAEELADQPHMEQVRHKLLEDALQYYQGFLEQKGNDPSVRHGAALAYLQVGSIQNQLGQYDKCLEPLGKGIAMLEGSGKHHPLPAQDREAIAAALEATAYANHWIRPGTEIATAERRKILALYEGLQREYPTKPAYLLAVAEAHADLGNALKAADRPNEAIDQFRQALKLCERHRTDFPDLPEDRRLMAHIRHWLGASLEYTGRLEEAEQEFRAAHDLREQLVVEQPDRAWRKHQLAHVKNYLAGLLMKTGRLAEAGQLLQQAVTLDEKLLEDFPDVGDYRKTAGWHFESFGMMLMAEGRLQEAEAAFRRSIAIREKLVADAPNLAVHSDDLGGSCYNLGILLEGAGRSGEAAEVFRKALGIWSQLVTPSPKTRSCERHLAWLLATCPVVELRDPPRAVLLAKQALQTERESATHWRVLGIAQYRAGDAVAATESLHKSMEMANGGDARQWLFLAMIYWQKEDRQQARQWYDKAAAWIEKVHPADESYARFRAEAAGLMELTK